LESDHEVYFLARRKPDRLYLFHFPLPLSTSPQNKYSQPSTRKKQI
jgi:hypothetical protein